MGRTRIWQSLAYYLYLSSDDRRTSRIYNCTKLRQAQRPRLFAPYLEVMTLYRSRRAETTSAVSPPPPLPLSPSPPAVVTLQPIGTFRWHVQRGMCIVKTHTRHQLPRRKTSSKSKGVALGIHGVALPDLGARCKAMVREQHTRDD